MVQTLGSLAGDEGEDPVGGFGGPGLVRSEQVGHDPEDPAHEGLRVHPRPDAQLHELGRLIILMKARATR